MKGEAAAHTGKSNGNWAGSRQGPNYTVQANIMVGPEVVDAVAASFESTHGTGMPLAERMILALEAGQAKGGDRRWGSLQSAAIKIADPKNPGRGGDYIALAIEVGEHAEPVGEMKRIYYTTARRLGYRAFSRVEGPDVIELKRMLHALGYWRPDARDVSGRPAAPAGLNRYDDEAIAAVDKFRADKALNYQGNPPGLVDARFIDALRQVARDVVLLATEPPRSRHGTRGRLCLGEGFRGNSTSGSPPRPPCYVGSVPEMNWGQHAQSPSVSRNLCRRHRGHRAAYW